MGSERRSFMVKVPSVNFGPPQNCKVNLSSAWRDLRVAPNRERNELDVRSLINEQATEA